MQSGLTHSSSNPDSAGLGTAVPVSLPEGYCVSFGSLPLGWRFCMGDGSAMLRKSSEGEATDLYGHFPRSVDESISVYADRNLGDPATADAFPQGLRLDEATL